MDADECADKAPQIPVDVQPASENNGAAVQNVKEEAAQSAQSDFEAVQGGEVIVEISSETLKETLQHPESLAQNIQGSEEAIIDGRHTPSLSAPNNQETTIEDADNDADHVLSLSATQVWTRSKGALRDDTERARGEFSTPASKAKAAKCSLSPGTELDHLTPSFLKRIFTVLNDNMAGTPRSAGVGSRSRNGSPVKSVRQSLSPRKEAIVQANDADFEKTQAVPANTGQLEAENEQEHEQAAADGGKHAEMVVPEAKEQVEEDEKVEPKILLSDTSVVQEAQDRPPEQPSKDETQILLDFLSHAELSKAKKAASIARRSSLANRRDSSVIRAALASPRKQPHDILDETPESPVEAVEVSSEPTKDVPVEAVGDVNEADENTETMTDKPSTDAQTTTANIATAAARSSRRSTRIPKQAIKTTITITTPSPAQDQRLLNDAASRALAATTRANTRRNKGTSISVPIMLKKLEGVLLGDTDLEQEEQVRPSRIQWKVDIAQYCEIEAREESVQAKAAPEESDEASEQSRAAVAVQTNGQSIAKTIPRPRRVARPRPAVTRAKSIPAGKEQEADVSAQSAAAPAVPNVPEDAPRRTPLMRSRSAPVVSKRKREEEIAAPVKASKKESRIVVASSAPAAGVTVVESAAERAAERTTSTMASLPPPTTTLTALRQPRRIPQPIRNRGRTAE